MIETPKVSDQSLIYMYGLSDFWTDIFGDTELVEAVLASTTIELAEVYSYFLQRAAGISLADVGERYKTRIKLLLLSESDAMDEELTTFPVDRSIDTMSKISNRPILPTQTLDNDVHFEVMNGTIRFHKSIKDLKFPVRYTSDGDVQYALWMVDVEIDENWIDNSFGRLVGFTEEDAIFNYKSFLEGVYYLYTNGPNIDYIERGVNLAMGMPYARLTETVLDIQQDSETGNWVIFTETQSYEMPFGYFPDITVGSTLTQNEVLSTWVQVKDWVRDGEWWYDVYLPDEVLGGLSNSVSVGKAVPGSAGDKMMNTFLKHHLFEVLITQPNGDNKSFNTARNLVLYSKPEYTFPIFVWKAPLTDELIDIQDDLSLSLKVSLEDTCVSPPSVRFMDRGEEDSYFYRGKHWYNRFQGSMYAATLLGYGDWPGNAGWSPEFSCITDKYMPYMDVLMRTRGDEVSPINRGVITRGWRGAEQETDVNGNLIVYGLTWKVPGSKVYPTQSSEFTFSERDATPLYMMRTSEMLSKIRTLHPGFNVGDKDFRFVLTGVDLPNTYDTFMVRGSGFTEIQDTSSYRFGLSEGGLDINMSIFANQSYIPSRDDMYDRYGDPIRNGTLFFSQNSRDVWSVYWVRHNITSAPTIFPVEDVDYLKAIEVYDQNLIGNTFAHRDKPITEGQQVILSPVILGSEGTAIMSIGGYYIPSYLYDVGEDNASITLLDPAESNGHVYWAPYLYDERILPANGSTYLIPETLTDREDILIAYSPISSNYQFIHDYVIASDPGGTQIILDSVLPPGGDLIVIYLNHGDAPIEESFSPAGNTYQVQTGYTVKIFTEGRILADSEYLVSGSQLTFLSEPTSDFIVRYYPMLSYELQSSFNRSSVQRNQARMLMDRSRPNGEYDDFWDGKEGQGTPNIYMNRSGVPWLEVPELGADPVYAENINVVRRLR